MVMCDNKIDDNKKYTSNAGDFDCHVDATVQWGVHLLIEHIPGFTKSHTQPFGKCLHRIAAMAAAIVDDVGQKQKQNTTKNYF